MCVSNEKRTLNLMKLSLIFRRHDVSPQMIIDVLKEKAKGEFVRKFKEPG